MRPEGVLTKGDVFARQGGFSLSEMLVATALGGMVLASAFAFVASQRPIYMHQSNIQSTQQNLWLAMEFIQRDVRRAGMGFGFCQKTIGAVVYKAQFDLWPAAAAQPQSLRAVDVGDGGTTGADTLTIAYGQPPSSGAADSALAAPGVTLWSSTSLLLDPAHDGKTFLSPTGCQCGGGTPCTLYSSPPTYALLFSPTATNPVCNLIQITAINTCATDLACDTRPMVPWTTFLSQGGGVTSYTAGMQASNVGSLLQIRYSIDAATDPQNPRLIRRTNGAPAEIIGYGIEDFQVSPGCDVNNDGLVGPEGATPAAQQADEWFNNVAADTVTATCSTYPEVKMTLVARTITIDSGFAAGARPAVANRNGGVADGFHHRLLSSVATAPNVAL